MILLLVTVAATATSSVASGLRPGVTCHDAPVMTPGGPVTTWFNATMQKTNQILLGDLASDPFTGVQTRLDAARYCTGILG
eukprot:2116422-Rhodomonas_salina.2